MSAYFLYFDRQRPATVERPKDGCRCAASWVSDEEAASTATHDRFDLGPAMHMAHFKSRSSDCSLIRRDSSLLEEPALQLRLMGSASLN